MRWKQMCVVCAINGKPGHDGKQALNFLPKKATGANRWLENERVAET